MTACRWLLFLVEIAVLLDDHGKKDEQCRAGGEGGGQETCSHDGRQPVVPAGQTRVQKSRHGMDTHSPGDGGINQRLYPIGIMYALAFCFKHVPTDYDVQEEITVQNDHIPEENRVGCGIK